MYQRADQSQLLLHAPGKLPGKALAERGHPCGCEQPGCAALHIRPAQAEEARVKPDVLFHRQVFVEAEPLRHVAYLVLDAFGIAGDVEAGDIRRSGSRGKHAGEHPDRRRLARTVRPYEAEYLPVADVEA